MNNATTRDLADHVTGCAIAAGDEYLTIEDAVDDILAESSEETRAGVLALIKADTAAWAARHGR